MFSWPVFMKRTSENARTYLILVLNPFPNCRNIAFGMINFPFFSLQRRPGGLGCRTGGVGSAAFGVVGFHWFKGALRGIQCPASITHYADV